MKARIAILLFLSLLASHLPKAWAQESMHEQRMKDHHPRWLPEDLRLTDKQIKQIGSIERRYLEEMRALRHELLNKRYSLQRLLSDPTTKPKKIKARQREVFALENQIEEKLLDYQLEMREILTPDQFRLWVSRKGMPSGRGMHHGRGKHMMHR